MQTVRRRMQFPYPEELGAQGPATWTNLRIAQEQERLDCASVTEQSGRSQAMEIVNCSMISWPGATPPASPDITGNIDMDFGPTLRQDP